MHIRRKSLAFILILLLSCAFSFIACKEEGDSSILDSLVSSSMLVESTQEESSLTQSSQEESSMQEESSFIEESSIMYESSVDDESSIMDESSIDEESSIEEDSSVEIAPPCSHDWEQETRIEYCDEYGIRVLACDLCGEKRTEAVNPIGHIEIQHEGYSATCEREGTTLSITCERCGDVLVESDTTPKVDHVYTDNACKWCGIPLLKFELREEGYYCIGTDASDVRKVIIPDEYEEEPVVGVAKDAFASRYGLNSLTIGKNVEVIEAGAFDYCCNLVEVYDFSEVQVTSIPANMIDLGYYVLDVYTQPAESKLHKDENGYITYDWLDKNGEAQVVFLGYKGEQPADNTLRIPKGVSIINWYSVSPTKWVRSVVLSDTVKYIRRFAFYYCPNLEELTIGESVEKIDIDLFDTNNVLKSVVFVNTEKEDWRICFEESLDKPWVRLGYSIDDPEMVAKLFKPTPEEEIDYSKMYWKKYWVTLFP